MGGEAEGAKGPALAPGGLPNADCNRAGVVYSGSIVPRHSLRPFIVPFLRGVLLVAVLVGASFSSPAQIILSGNHYAETFNGLAGGLPVGWTVRTNATAGSLGVTNTVATATTTWSNTAFNFKNLAGFVSNIGTNFTGGEDGTIQNAATNRSLGLRQTGSGGDPGAAFVVQFQDTLGYTNFHLNLDLLMLSVQGRSTTWTIDYALGAAPTSFTVLGTNGDPGVFSATNRTFVFGPALDNQSQPVWIRVVALTATTGANSRDTFGLDNFSLTYDPLVGSPPVISNQPQDQVGIEAGPAAFQVGVSGLTPLAYQWQFNSTNLPNATNATLTLLNLNFNQAGSYRVIVTNVYGAVTSTVAQLTVNPSPPSFTAHPVNQTVPAGSNATFSVSVAGTAPFFYQWLRNSTNLANATNASLTITNVTSTNLGSFACIVSNAGGTVTSAPAVLALSANNVKLLTYNVKGNGTGDFSTNTAKVQAIGRQVVYLQPDIITFNEIPASETYQVANFVAQYLPGYHVATNSATDGYIRSAIVSRWPITRSTRWLDNASLTNYGYDGIFTRDLFEAVVAVPGFGQPLHVFTAHLKSGSDTDSSTKRAAEAGAVSNYFVTSFLTTNASHPYVLTGDLNEDINLPPSNTGYPLQRLANSATGLQLTTPTNRVSGEERTFSIQSTPLQRRYDYILPSPILFPHILDSEVFRTDLLNPLPPGLNANDDSVSSDHLPVYMVFNSPYVQQPLYLTQQPATRTNVAGSVATFTVVADGVAPFSYQWLKNGTNLPGDTRITGVNEMTLQISNVVTGDAGTYSVLVTNEITNLLSSAASLVVLVPPVITIPPVGVTNVTGSSFTLTVTATGTAPLTYRWFLNGTNLAAATGSSYTKSGAQLADAGTYTVTVSNAAATATSSGTQVKLAAPLAQWNFNSPAPDANSGTGTLLPAVGNAPAAEPVGGPTNNFFAGASGDTPGDNSGWSTAPYPAATTGNKTAGVLFRVSTVNRETIFLNWQQRVTATASKYYRLQYTTNGTTFLDWEPAIVMAADSTFESKSVNLTGVPNVANNANFGFRIVSEWESTATGAGNSSYVGTTSGYSTGGAVRFDLVTVAGTPVAAGAFSLQNLTGAGGNFGFGVAGPAGLTFIVQSSTNLLQWANLQTNVAPFTFTQTNLMALPQQYFRVVAP